MEFSNWEFENESSLKKNARDFILNASQSISDIGSLSKHFYSEDNKSINILDDVCFAGKTRSLNWIILIYKI